MDGNSCQVPEMSKLQELFSTFQISTPISTKDSAKLPKIELIPTDNPKLQQTTFDFRMVVMNSNPSFQCEEMVLLCQGVTKEHVHELVDTLHSDYFALVLATGFINEGVCTISKYLEMYAKVKETLMEDTSIEFVGFNESTFITTILKYYELCPNEKIDSLNVLEIIACISYLDIPLQYFEFYPDESMNAAMRNELYYYTSLNFIAFSPDKTLVRVHPVVHEALIWILKQMSLRAQLKRLSQVVKFWKIYLINSKDPNTCERLPNQIELVKTIRRNMVGFKELRPHAILLGITECAQLLGCYQFQELMDFAQDIFHTDSEWTEGDDLGDEYLEHVLQTRRLYAAGLAGVGRYEEALCVLNDIFDKTEHTDAFGHRMEVFLVLNDIGGVLVGLGREKEALKIYDNILSKSNKDGSTDIAFMDVMHNKARCLWKLGEVDKAMPISTHLFQQRLKSPNFGPNDVATMAEKFYFGYGLMKTGQMTQALKVLEQVYKSQGDLFGLNHPKSLNTWNLIQHAKSMVQEEGLSQKLLNLFRKKRRSEEEAKSCNDSVRFLMAPLQMFLMSAQVSTP